jgi:hypothetical protein
MSCSLALADSKRQGARALALIAEFENDIRRECNGMEATRPRRLALGFDPSRY